MTKNEKEATCCQYCRVATDPEKDTIHKNGCPEVDAALLTEWQAGYDWANSDPAYGQVDHRGLNTPSYKLGYKVGSEDYSEALRRTWSKHPMGNLFAKG